MKTLQDLYKEDALVADNFIDSLNLQVSIKLNGISLQIYFNEETEEYEYHTHSKDIAIGPKISKLTKYFCKDITDAIAYFDEKQDIVNQYRFINTVIYNKELYLLSVMLKNNTNIIDDNESIGNIANMLGIKSTPILWHGRLSKDQQSAIKNMVTSNTIIDSTLFKDRIQTIFISPTYYVANYSGMQMLQNIDYLEGVVFSVNFGQKQAKYEIIDSQYEQLKKEIQTRKNFNKLQYKDDYAKLTRCFVDWLELKAANMDESHMASLEKNFVNMCSNEKILMKMLFIAGKLPVRADSQFMLQINMLSDPLQQLIRKHGTPMRTLIEHYLLTFYKHKKNLDYDKDLIERIDKIIDVI